MPDGLSEKKKDTQLKKSREIQLQTYIKKKKKKRRKENHHSSSFVVLSVSSIPTNARTFPATNRFRELFATDVTCQTGNTKYHKGGEMGLFPSFLFGFPLLVPLFDSFDIVCAIDRAINFVFFFYL